MTVMSVNLHATEAELSTALDVMRADLQRRFPDVRPELIQDTQGRYLVLDAVTTLAKVRLALAEGR